MNPSHGVDRAPAGPGVGVLDAATALEATSPPAAHRALVGSRDGDPQKPSTGDKLWDSAIAKAEHIIRMEAWTHFGQLRDRISSQARVSATGAP